MNKVSSADVKMLNTFINEPDELKRYLLCQCWIHQYIHTYNENNYLTPFTTTAAPSSYYEIMRDIKQTLINKNETLNELLKQLQNQFKLLKLINSVFELQQQQQIDDLSARIKTIETTINTNSDYINKINNLSENQIEAIINNDNKN